MTGSVAGPIALVVGLILLGGVFSATEFALVSLRESQLDQLAETGSRGRRVSAIARDPNRFLAAVQIGMTLTGLLSAAYGASELAPRLAPFLERLGLGVGLADTVAMLLLTLAVAYFTLVFGELVPKRFALQRATKIATLAAPPLDRFATIARPVVWLLSQSTNVVVRLMGGDPAARAEAIDEAELQTLITRQESMSEHERRILSDVFAAADRTIAEAMTPRGEVVFLPASLTLAEAAERTRELPYSRYPVTGRGFDDVLGFVHVRDLLQPPLGADSSTTRVHAVKRPILALPWTNAALATISVLRAASAHIAVVVDEYGGTDGIITLEDLVEELVGEIHDEYDLPVEVYGAGVYDAGLTIEEFHRATGVELADGPYETIAGYVITALGRLAQSGDAVDLPPDETSTPTLQVRDVDGRRIRTVTLTRTPRSLPNTADS